MSNFGWWLVNCGVDEREITTLYKQLNNAAGTLLHMKVGSAKTRKELIQECWILQRKIAKLYDEIDPQLQTAIDVHQKRTEHKGRSV